MRRKLLVCLVLAAFAAEASGCSGTKPTVRGQSPERRVDLARLRRKIRRDVEPVLDATCKVGKKVEPGWDATKDVTRKGLVLGGILAYLGGLWWLDQGTTPFQKMYGPTLGNGNGLANGN